MGYTFDGPNKRIVLTAGTTNVSVQDMYSRWIDWLDADTNNGRYLPAFSTVGGDPLPGGIYLGTTYFLENGWKVRPQEADHQLTISGNICSRDGSSPLVPTIGTYNVVVSMTVSNLLNTVATGGNSYTLGEIADAVWDEPMIGHVSPQTMGRLAQIASSVNAEMLVTGTPTQTSIQVTQGSAVDNFYNDATLIVLSGAALGSVRPISAYNGTSKTFTVDEPFPVTPAPGDTVIVFTNHIHPVSQIADGVWGHVSAAQIINRMTEAWGRLGLDPLKPLVTGQTQITFGDIVMALTESGGNVTATRQ